MPSREHDPLELDESPSTRPALTSCRAKDFDLALAGESTCDLETFSCKGESGDLGISYLQDEEDMEVEHFLRKEISEEALSGKSTSQQTLFEHDVPGKQ